jgi:antitoxin (DNA-binding transcriptional repressor) of toxin-antitoxin stability system
MVQVTSEEAKSKLSDLIAQAMEGETVFIKEDENKIVLLMPIASSRGKRQFGSAKGLIHISDDFDEPLEDFKEYME